MPGIRTTDLSDGRRPVGADADGGVGRIERRLARHLAEVRVVSPFVQKKLVLRDTRKYSTSSDDCDKGNKFWRAINKSLRSITEPGGFDSPQA